MFSIKKIIGLFALLIAVCCLSAVVVSAATVNPLIHPSAAPNQKALVILVGFNDTPLSTTDAQWSAQFFSNSGSTVRNYYDENSGGKVIFGPAAESNGTANDGVVRIQLNQNHPGTAGKAKEVIQNDINKMGPEIMNNVDQAVDFAVFDTNKNGTIEAKELCIVLIIAGYEMSETPARSPTPHFWAYDGILDYTKNDGVTIPNYLFSSIGELYPDGIAQPIGTVCHELGHSFGLPDLYNRIDSTFNVFASLMDSGSAGLLTGQRTGETPVHMDAYCKIKLGYVIPTIANRSGEYTVNSFNAPGGYNVLRINTKNPKEYFLIENRQFNGFDAEIQADRRYVCNYPGICILHVDESMTSNDGSIKMVKTERVANIPFYSIESSHPVFGPSSSPNSSLNSGEDSFFQIEVKSPLGDSMKVQITAKEIYTDPRNAAPVIQSFTSSTNRISTGTINFKAVIKDNGIEIPNVVFHLNLSAYSSKDFIGKCTGQSNGYKTYEATVGADSFPTDGTYEFSLLLEDQNFKVMLFNSQNLKWDNNNLKVVVNKSLPSENLALNKPATASMELTTMDQVAARAVNGNINDKWCSGIGYGNGSWLLVDLGAAKTINRWKVVHSSGAANTPTLYTTKFRLQVSNDGVYAWKTIDTVDNSAGMGITDRAVTPFKGRYIRLYIDYADVDNCSRIHEFELYNDTIKGVEANFDTLPVSQPDGSTRILGNPDYSNTIAYSQNVAGYTSGAQPESLIKGDFYHSGKGSLSIAGTDNNSSISYCYHTVYDNLNIQVTPDTVLSYYLLPQNYNGRFTGVDFEFEDGSSLSNVMYGNAVDQNGISIQPKAGRGTPGIWNYVRCNIGKWCSGRTIKKILVAYDQPQGTGQYKANIDDIVIREESTATVTGIKADFEGGLSVPNNKLKPLGIPDSFDKIVYSCNVTGFTSGTNPVCSPRTNESVYAGSSSLLIAGTANSATEANYCYYKVYENVNFTVSPSTNLSYWIMPVNSNGRHVGVDMEFTDGTTLRASMAVDLNGVWLHPDGAKGTGGRGNVGAWNYITSNIGQWCNGKVIKTIMVGYDQPLIAGQYKAYIDDIIITK